jgi:WD40 repeat protein
LACSPDGRWLASAGNDKTLRIWNVADGNEAKRIPVDDLLIEALAFSADGQKLASGGTGNTLIVWDVATGEAQLRLPGHTAAITAIVFSDDGKFVASGSADRSVKIWDLTKGKRFKDLPGHTDNIEALRFSTDGGFLVSGGDDKILKVWKTSTGKVFFEAKDNAGRVLSARFLRDGRLLYSDSSGTVKTLDVAAKRITNSLAARVGPDFAEDAVESEAISVDGSILAIADGGRTASVYATTRGERLISLESHLSGFFGVAFSPSQRWLAMAGNDNSVKLWDLKTGQEVASLAGHAGYVTALAFDSGNQRLFSASSDGTIGVWDPISEKSIGVLKRHTSSIGSLATGDVGRWLISGSADKTVGVWDLRTGAEPRLLTGHSGEVTSVSITKDEKLVASGSIDGSVRLWDPEKGSFLRTIADNLGEIKAVTFSPDGKLLAAAGADGSVRIWSVVTGVLDRTIPAHTGKVTSIYFTPDGKQLVSASEDKTISKFTLADTRPKVFPPAHTSSISSLSLSGDGKWLASASEDGSVVIWDVGDERRVCTLVSARAGDDWLVVTPEGYFDGSPTTWSQILWRFGDDLYSVTPVEVFFNEFYQPGLLTELLGGKPLPPADITQKDRRQPELHISLDEGKNADSIADRYVNVTIKIKEAGPDSAFNRGSGAKDVRLFRNGSLVYFKEGDAVGEAAAAEIRVSVPIVEGPNVLTAYAFNSDDIKSKDETLNLTGAQSLHRKGKTHIITIGVGKSSNPDFSLDFVAEDATVFGEILRAKQLDPGLSESVDVTRLTDENATKENIINALKELAADSGNSKAAQPEDTVVVYFSGHGFSEADRFYMIPHDIGYKGRWKDLPASPDGFKTIMQHGISDRELETAFRGIDAKNIMLIIDACESGQALQAKDARQGPMNSKGLVQFAYEKGMFILTATQGAEAAYVADAYKRSYLNYALIDEGLKENKADENTDGTVLLREWFGYATRRVPELQEDAAKKLLESAATGQAKSLTERAALQRVDEQRREQRPRAFYRRQPERLPVVIARVGGQLTKN